MDKAIYSAEQTKLIELLRTLREQAGLRQVDVAIALGVPQSFVSKYETGERRLDLIELKHLCEVLGLTLVELIGDFEGRQ